MLVLVALVRALVGGTLASHTGHDLLYDVGDLFIVFVFRVGVLFDLVVVHVECFVVNLKVLVVLGCLGLVRGLVANEGVWALAVFCLENAAGLNFAKLTEDVSEVLFGLVAETFNIEVASLLPKFRFLEGGMYIEVQSLVIFAVELLDGLGGATMSILNVFIVW